MPARIRPLKPAADQLLLYIELKWIEPVIWRRFVVPANITLGKLHHVIQAVMGWSGSHLHDFEIAGEHYGEPDTDGWGPVVHAEARKTLVRALMGKKTFSYLYDFGDIWEHKIKVEKTLPPGTAPQLPYCVDGANACPPEDVGGPPGYEHFRQVMADTNHPEHADMLDWFCGEFDPEAFDIHTLNPWLKKIIKL